MIGNKQTFLKKKQKDDNYVCPHTLVYDIEFGEREPTDVTYYFLLKNTACSSGATIDFGDGVISTNVRSNPDYDALSAATILSHTYANASGTYRVSFDMNDINKFKQPSEGSDFALFGISAPYWQIATSGTAYVIKDDFLLQNKKSWVWADKFIGINENESWYPITIVDFNEIELCSALYNWPVFSHVNDVKMSNRQFQKLQSNSLLHRSGNFNSIVSPIHHLELGENGHSPHGYGYAKCIFPDLTNISIKAPIKPKIFEDVNVRTIDNEKQYFNDNIITVDEMPSTSEVLSGACFVGLGCKCLDFSKLSSYTTVCSSLCEASNVREVILPSSINKIEKWAFENSPISSINLENIETIGEYVFCACHLVSANLNNLVSSDEGAFDSCKKLLSINMPKLSGIPNYMMSYCSSLSSINIPCATYIGMDAIRHCGSLISADFPNVTHIETGGMEQCESLTCVNVSSALEIDEYAFCLDTALTSVNIENATYLGESVFEECYALTGINAKNVRSLSCAWTFWGCSSLISADIRSATSIGEEVFENCFSLKYVDARSAKTLGSNAFNNCNSLEYLNLSSLLELGESAFAYSRLKSIDISNVRTISGWTFEYSDLENIKADNVITIKNDAFHGCSHLSAVSFSSAETIEFRAFAECDNLLSISIDNVKWIGDTVFRDCPVLSSINASKATFIDPTAFNNCSSLISVNVAGLKTLNSNLLKDSKNSLQFVDVSGLSAVESGCFSNFYNGYTKLKSVNVSGAETIGESAFDSTSSLLEINAANARTIEDAAFYGCDSLSSLNISKATYIGEGALDKCSSLIYLNVASMPTLDHDIFVECYDSLQFIDASGLSAIESGTFSPLTALLSANINGVTEIGPSAFNGCSSLQYINADNASIISAYAFANCPSLKSIVLPNVTEIQNQSSVFNGCSSLLSLNLASLSSVESSLFTSFYDKLQYLDISSVSGISEYAFGGIEYVEDEEDDYGYIEVQYPTFTSLISANISGAEYIGYEAFENCTSLVYVDAANVKSIASYAFNNCESLTYVNVPNLSGVGGGAFQYCESLSSFDAPNCTTLGYSATFNRCKSLKYVNLPNVTSIGYETFNNCSSLSSANLQSVTSIGNYAFRGCSSLLEANFNSLTGVNNETFYGCTSLSSAELQNVMTVNKTAFYNCSSLISADLSSLTIAKESAFYNCMSLENIISDSLLSASSATFQNCVSLSSINLSNLISAGFNSFDGCCSLSAANLQNIKRAEDSAFAFTAITSVYSPNIEYIGASAFVFDESSKYATNYSLTPSLKTLYLDGELKYILGKCFYKQSNLSSIHLPSGLAYIGNEAFYDSNAASIAIPSTVNKIEKGAFAYANLSDQFDIPSTVSWNESASGAFENSSIKDVSIPSTNIIAQYMFANCSNLSSVEFSENVNYIEKAAFQNCTALSTIQLPSSLNYVQELGFAGCSSLSSIEFPVNVSYIGNNALSGCANLSIIKFNSIFNLNSNSFNFGDNNVRTIILPWHSGDIAGAPWGAGSNTTFTYTGEFDATNIISPSGIACAMPQPLAQVAYMPFTYNGPFERSLEIRTGEIPVATKSPTSQPILGYEMIDDNHKCMRFLRQTNGGIFGWKYTECLDDLDLDGDISMSMWLKFASAIINKKAYKFVLLGENSTNKGIYLFGRTDSKLYAGAYGNDIGGTTYTTSQLRTWMHQVVTYDHANHLLKFYMNDALIGSKTVTLSITKKELNMGYVDNLQCLDANFHDLRIYNKCLTPANVHWLYEHKC